MRIKRLTGVILSAIILQSYATTDTDYQIDSKNTADQSQPKFKHSVNVKKINAKQLAKYQDTASDGQKSSNALKGATSLGAQVDDQTGQLNLSLPIISLPGIAADIGLNLAISYQQQKSQDQDTVYGLIKGWTYNISYIKLSSGDPDEHPSRIYIDGGKSYIIDSTWKSIDSNGQIYQSGMKYYNLKNMQLTMKNGTVTFAGKDYDYAYLLTLSNGIKEYFDDYGKLIIKSDPFGNYIKYSYINIDYPESSEGTIDNVYLSSIQDSNNQTIKINRDNGTDDITFTLPDNEQVKISTSGGMIASVIDQIGRTTQISYSAEYPDFIGSISWPNDLTQTFYYNAKIKAPIGIDSDDNVITNDIPAVSQVDSSSSNDSNNTTRNQYYSYDDSGNNYLGNGAEDEINQKKVVLDGNIDSLLQSNDNSYTYKTIINNGLTETTNTYNHLHLLVHSETIELTDGHKNEISSSNYMYAGERADGDFGSYTALNLNYQTPNYASTTQYNTTSEANDDGSRSKIVKTQFDDYGRSVEVKTYEKKLANDENMANFLGSTDSDTFNLVNVVKSTYDTGYTQDSSHYGQLINQITYDYKPNGVFGKETPQVTYKLNTLVPDDSNSEVPENSAIQTSMLFTGGSDVIKIPQLSEWLKVVDADGQTDPKYKNAIYRLNTDNLDTNDYSNKELIIASSNDKPTVLKISHGWLYYGTESGDLYRASYASARGANKPTEYHKFNGKIVNIQLATDNTNLIVSYIDKDTGSLVKSGEIPWNVPSVGENIAEQTPTTETDGKLITYNYDAQGRPISQELEYATGASTGYAKAYGDTANPNTTYTYTQYAGDPSTYTNSDISDWQEQCQTNAQGYTNCQVVDLANGEVMRKLVRNRSVVENSKIKNKDTKALITSYTYDGLGRKLSETSPMGLVSSYEYDDNKNMVIQTTPTGYKSYKKFNSFGQVIEEGEIKDGDQVPFTSYSYNDLEQKISQTDKILNQKTTYGYDSQGRISSITDAEGDKKSFQYDVANLTKAEFYNGTEVSISNYNDQGDEINSSQISAGGSSNGAEQTLVNIAKYNGNNKKALLQSVDNSTSNGSKIGSTVTTLYDAEGKPTEHHIQGDDNITGDSGVARDLLGNALYKHITVTYPNDTAANKITVRPAYCGYDNGYCTDKLTYNNAGQLLFDQIPTDPSKTNAIKQFSFTYDDYGRLFTKTDPKGIITSYLYNQDSKKTDVIIDDPNNSASNEVKYHYEYYPAGEFVGLLKAVSKTNASGIQTLSYKYNYQGKMLSITYPDKKNVSWTYNDKNQLGSFTDAFKDTTNYVYDDYGRITSYKYEDAQDSNAEQDVTINYYPYKDKSINSGQISDVDYSNGVKVNYTYNGLNQIADEDTQNKDGKDIIDVKYKYDSLQNNTSTVYSSETNPTLINENHTELNSYNSFHQLTKQQLVSNTTNATYQTIKYTYDESGNILSKTIDTP